MGFGCVVGWLCVSLGLLLGRGVLGWVVSCQAQGCLMQRVNHTMLVCWCLACCGCRVLLLRGCSTCLCNNTCNMLGRTQNTAAVGSFQHFTSCVTSKLTHVTPENR